MVSIHLPRPQHLFPLQVKLVEPVFCSLTFLPFLLNFLTLFAILAVEAMSHFLGNVYHPLTFRTTQGFSLTTGRSPLSSILLIVAPSPTAATGVLPITIGLPASLADQDLGNLLVFPRGRSILPKLLSTRGNN